MQTGCNANDKNIYPLGLTLLADGIFVKVASKCHKLALLLFKRNEEKEFLKVDFDTHEKVGDVWFLRLKFDISKFKKKYGNDIEYIFENEYGLLEDKYGKCFSGKDTFGKLSLKGNKSRCPVFINEYEVYDRPGNKLSEAVIYRINVRAFTKSRTSKVIQKGTFLGLAEKIDYIKELGINTVLLMPVSEFDELIDEDRSNIWGYAKTKHFAPKASLCKKRGRNPIKEVKDMVSIFHKEGIEVFTEFYFDEYEPVYSLEVLRYWVLTYKIDGIYISGRADIDLIVKDPYLKDIKLIFSNSESFDYKNARDNIIIYNNNFRNVARKFLKGDEGMLGTFLQETKLNSKKIKQLKFLADYQGFSLNDLLSFDVKHNEANKELNKDGEEYNYSWNCGEEGRTKKKRVLELRKKMLKNASVFTFLSPGIPLLCAGDEFLAGRKGNNNAYCIDNEDFWLDWKDLKRNEYFYEWIKYLIAFRKKYKAFSRDEEYRMLDTKAIGIPDLSAHGVQAWKPEFDIHKRELALFYSGEYFNSEDIYIIYNMHWESHTFALPRIDKKKSWYMAVDTAKDDINGHYKLGEEKELREIKDIELESRSIVVLLVKDRGKNECI